MNQYWLMAFIIFLGSIGFAGYRYGVDATEIGCQKHDEAQQQITITAENNVIATIGKQQTLTQESQHAYHTGIAVIDDLYRVQPNVAATGHNLPAISNTANRIISPQNSREFGLNLKQCDIEEQKLISLWEWIRAQQAVK